MSAKAANQAVWEYSARIHQVDREIDAAQDRGDSSCGLGSTLLLLCEARRSEQEDVPPIVPADVWREFCDTLPTLERYLSGA